MKNYSDKLKDPRWQKKRLEILQRDNFKCRVCNDSKSTLHVHHIYYHEDNKNPWDYSNNLLITLCDKCHELEHKININDYYEFYLKNLMALTNSCLLNMKDLADAITKDSVNYRQSLLENFKINILRLISKS
jgi:hypothetical protein